MDGRDRFHPGPGVDVRSADPKAFPRSASPTKPPARRSGAAWLSAANEVAVAAFLADDISWCDIIDVVARVMDGYVADPLDSLADLVANDATARARAHGILNQ